MKGFDAKLLSELRQKQKDTGLSEEEVPPPIPRRPNHPRQPPTIPPHLPSTAQSAATSQQQSTPTVEQQEQHNVKDTVKDSPEVPPVPSAPPVPSREHTYQRQQQRDSKTPSPQAPVVSQEETSKPIQVPTVPPQVPLRKEVTSKPKIKVEPPPVQRASPESTTKAKRNEEGGGREEFTEWETYESAEGEPYFVNRRTGETTWDKPLELRSPEDAALEGEFRWVRHETLAWVPAKVLDETTVCEYGLMVPEGVVLKQRRKVSKEELGPSIHAPSQSLRNLTDDLVQLDVVHEASIIDLLRRRYKEDKIYTRVGDILVAVNPFKPTTLFTPATMHSYREENTFTLPPHPYEIIDAAFRSSAEQDQSILISGESGAGKTVTVKVCLEYLSEVAVSDSSNLEEKILAANPILEAFGNAKTLRNDNSSRFGKFMEVHLRGKAIIGCYTVNYLLEKSRVVARAKEERNFHVFYYLLQQLPIGKRKKYLVADTTDQDYAYLQPNQSSDLSKSDAKECTKMLHGFNEMGFTEEQVDNILCIVSAVLQLGNVSFDSFETTGSKVSSSSLGSLNKFCTLLGLSSVEALETALTMHVSTQRDGVLQRAFTPSVAKDATNALARHLYGRLFDWLVQRINVALVLDESILSSRGRSSRNLLEGDSNSSSFIGILDIFGFEIFESNSFEQLCINFANEKLQQMFNCHTFTLEEATYVSEGIPFEKIHFHDSQPLLSFLGLSPAEERSVRDGVFQLLDEQTAIGSGTDEKFLHALSARHKDKKDLFSDYCQSSRTAFSVFHYAGSVDYETRGFVAKNADKLYSNLADVLREANNPVVKELFPSTVQKAKTKTQASVFMQQLTQLERRTASTYSRYIRCIKPNSKKAPDLFNSASCLEQLKFAGVFEAVSIRKLGFPFRLGHRSFYEKYKCIGGDLTPLPATADFRKASETLLSKFKELEGCRIGKSMVLYRASQHRTLEIKRLTIFNKAAAAVQKIVRGALVRAKIPVLLKSREQLLSAIAKRSAPSLKALLVQCKTLFFKLKEVYDAEIVLKVLEQEALMIQPIQALLNETSQTCSEESYLSMDALVSQIKTYRNRDPLAFSATEVEQLMSRVDAVARERTTCDELHALVSGVSSCLCDESIAAFTQLLNNLRPNLDKSLFVKLKPTFAEADGLLKALVAERLQLLELCTLSNACALRRLEHVSGIGSLDTSKCDTESLSKCLSTSTAVSSDGSQLLKLLQAIVEVRESVLEALEAEEKGNSECWSPVESKVAQLNSLQLPPESSFVVDSGEIEVLLTELALRAEAGTVVEKITAASTDRNDVDLKVLLDQADRLNLSKHEDVHICALVVSAKEMLELLSRCREALMDALSDSTLAKMHRALVLQEESLFGNGPEKVGNELVEQVKRLFSIGLYLREQSILSSRCLYVDHIQVILQACKELGLKLEETENLASFLELSEVEQLQHQLDAAVRLKNYKRALRVSLEIKEIFFSESGSLENFQLIHFPNLKSPEEFAKRFGINWSKYKEKMLSYYNPTFGKIHTSLTVLNPPEAKRSVYLFKNILGIMGDKVYTSEAIDGLLNDLLEQGLSNVELRDEIYCQLCKQLNNNPRSESVEKGWNLMTLVLSTFPPSRELSNYLEHFLRTSSGCPRSVLETLHKAYICGQLKSVPPISSIAVLRHSGRTDAWFGGERNVTCAEEDWTGDEKQDQQTPDYSNCEFTPAALHSFDSPQETKQEPKQTKQPPPPPPPRR